MLSQHGPVASISESTRRLPEIHPLQTGVEGTEVRPHKPFTADERVPLI